MQNVEIWVVCGLQATKGHRQLNHLIEHMFNFNRNYASILHNFQVIASYLPKVAYFDLPHLHLLLALGVIPVKFCQGLP